VGLAAVERVEVIALSSLKDELLSELQEAGILELETVEPELGLEPVSGPEVSLEPLLFRFRQAIKYLSLWKKSGLQEKLFKPKPTINREERQAILKQDWDSLLKAVEEVELKYREIGAELKGLEKEKALLLPWQPLTVPLSELKPTATVEVFLIRLNRSRLPELSSLLSEWPLWFSPVSQDKKNAYLFLLAWKPALDEIEEKWKELGVSFFYLPESLLKKMPPADKVQDLMAHLEQEIIAKKQYLLSLEAESRRLTEWLPQLTSAYDVLANEQERINAYNRLAQTEKTVFLRGWIKSADLEPLKKRLDPLSSSLEIRHRPPVAGEEPPVVLKNPAVLQPFQIITQLYGFPRPGGIDPTLPLAPFFFLFVGLCVSEAGYGLLVALLSLFFWLKVKPKGSTLLFSQLMLFLGVSTIILGTLVGGWFGFPVRQLLIIDPLTQPVSFLLLALALGFIQVWFGTLIKAISCFQKKETIPVGLTQTGWLVLLPSIVLYGLKKIQIFGFISLLGAGLVILFASPKRNPIARFLGGLYGLYDISKYLGDVLSYSRLLALGLSTSVIAMVVNTLCQTALNIPIVGWVVTPIIFLGGHLFNLAISFLGGFVHSMRLQFVEFFTKFYESGGKPLRPLALQGKYVDFQ